MKVLVADKISPKGVAFLRQQPGLEVIEAYGSSPEKVLELVKDVSAIAVRSETKITAAVFAAAPKLKVVGRAGVDGGAVGKAPHGRSCAQRRMLPRARHTSVLLLYAAAPPRR